jgi:hypothetical protein
MSAHGLSALDEAEAYWSALAGWPLTSRRVAVRALLELRVSERVWWIGRGPTTWARWWEVES